LEYDLTRRWSHKDKKWRLASSLQLNKQKGPVPAAFLFCGVGGSREWEESMSDLSAPRHQNLLGICLKEPMTIF